LISLFLFCLLSADRILQYLYTRGNLTSIKKICDCQNGDNLLNINLHC